MMNFLKSFFGGEKTESEKALLDAQKKHDVLAMNAAETPEEEKKEEKRGSCCGGCTCR